MPSPFLGKPWKPNIRSLGLNISVDGGLRRTTEAVNMVPSYLKDENISEYPLQFGNIVFAYTTKSRGLTS